MAAGLAVGTYLYARVWVNEDRLWAYTLARNPDAWIARLRLGVRLMDRERARRSAPPRVPGP